MRTMQRQVNDLVYTLRLGIHVDDLFKTFHIDLLNWAAHVTVEFGIDQFLHFF